MYKITYMCRQSFNTMPIELEMCGYNKEELISIAQVNSIDGKFDLSNIPNPLPTEAEQLRADVDYLAIMTGVEM